MNVKGFFEFIYCLLFVDRNTMELKDLQREVTTLEVCAPCTGAVRIHKKNSTVFIGTYITTREKIF